LARSFKWLADCRLREITPVLADVRHTLARNLPRTEVLRCAQSDLFGRAEICAPCQTDSMTVTLSRQRAIPVCADLSARSPMKMAGLLP